MLFVLLFKHRKHPHLMKKKTFISKPVDNIFVYFSIVKKKFNLNFVFFCSFTRQIMKRSKTYLLLCLSQVNKSKDFLYKWFVSFLYRSLHAPFKVKSRVSKSHLGILVVFFWNVEANFSRFQNMPLGINDYDDDQNLSVLIENFTSSISLINSLETPILAIECFVGIISKCFLIYSIWKLRL